MEKAIMEISVSSKAFKEGDSIPEKFTCDMEDVSPQLSWGKAPDGIKSWAMIMDDPDAPTGTFVHWVIFNIPPENLGLDENVPRKEILPDGSLQGKNDFRRIGYGGPCPPSGKPHKYRFKIYALDTKLGLSSGINKAQLLSAMEGHVIAQGELTGKYGR